MSQAYYYTTVGTFLLQDTNTIKGHLDKGISEHAQIWTIQFTSWEASINLFKSTLKEVCKSIPDAIDWTILLEYEIPRLLSRIDFVLLAKDLIFVVEYKHDRTKFESADVRQVEDYALDLKDFHLQSRDKIIIPVLLAPQAPFIEQANQSANDLVLSTIRANSRNLGDLLISTYNNNSYAESINVEKWINSKYSPTPTIIQAAQALFAGQKVEAITKAGAEQGNLNDTTNYVLEVIKSAQLNKEKIVCFVTGVPGAGKTLVGLNIIHREEFIEANESSAAYFSGNGPLVDVLREALTRDEYDRNNLLFANHLISDKLSKNTVKAKVESKIQNLHHFIKDGRRSAEAPHEQIVVFDEAQRCWDADNFYNKSVQSRVKEDNPIRKSEAEIIFEVMDRHSDWAVIIALVGNGQEINTGEAGIGEWGNVLKEKYSNWQIHISPELLLGGLNNSTKLFETLPPNVDVRTNSHLHLSISQRSFKANNLNDWVNAVIDNNPQNAKVIYETIKKSYPIVITKDLLKAKQWLFNRKQGNKRIGLIASSGGLRLRSYGINTKEVIDVPYWFLNDENDVRSSYYLEIVATEYKIQGLEIDWCGICWDGDLRRTENNWDFRRFKGTTWDFVRNQNDRQFF